MTCDSVWQLQRNLASEYRLPAERRLGEILAKSEKARRHAHTTSALLVPQSNR